jgi:hypothetical protein
VEKDADPVHTVDGLLEWGLKRSLYEYVSGTNGEIVTAGAAVIAPNFRFNFPLMKAIQTDGPEGKTLLKFAGGMRFRAHQGLMEIVVDDPWIEMDSIGSRLSASLGSASERSVLADLAYIEPELRGRETRWDEVPARLARTGTGLFDFRYAPGEELDPVSYHYARQPPSSDETWLTSS